MKRQKIRSKARKWIIHYFRIGLRSMNFQEKWPSCSDGASGVQAFAVRESTGKVFPTRCPVSIAALTAGKRVHGITVDMWAQDRASGLLPKYELKEYCNEVPGLFEEVERLKWKYIP